MPRAPSTTGPGHRRYPLGEVKRLLVSGGIVASLAVAGSTHSAPPPPALLTYAASSQPAPGLCLARADGTRRKRLTRGRDSQPSWSPRGVYVVFARQVGSESRIFVADTRGRILRRIGTGAGTEPAWSPDGRRIAYAAGNSIVVATRGGQTASFVTQGLAGSPAWSADSRRLAYSEIREAGDVLMRQIRVANADGTGRRTLFNHATDPSWARDGRFAYIGYASFRAEAGYVTVANADGTGARRLTTSAEPEASPAWSPTRAQIAFVRGGSVVVARASGGGERVAVLGASDPAWRPQTVLVQARRAAC